MKFVYSIDKQKYDKFVRNHPTKSHFLQSYEWGELSKAKGLIPHYVGVEEDGVIIAASLLLQKRLPLGYSYFYAPRGYVMDYTNLNLIMFMTSEVKKYISKYKGIFLKIDPDIELHKIDVDGKVTESGFNNFNLVNYLEKVGYTHKGFNKNFENSQPRYTFRLNLKSSINDIRANMHPTTRKIINRGNPYELRVTLGGKEKIKNFAELMNVTSKRDGFVSSSYKYYYDFYNILSKYKMCDFYYIEVSIEDVIVKTEKMIEETKKDLSNLKNEGKKRDLISKIDKLEKTLEEYRKYVGKYPNNVLVSGIIAVKYGNKVWTVHGGNHNILRELNYNYLLYYQILLNAKDEGYEMLDFFGTIGNPVPNNERYGIHLFKKRFGGEYIEFIGEFDLVCNNFIYFIFTKAIPLYRKIVKIIMKFRNKKSIK